MADVTGPWPDELLDDAGFRRFVSAELGLSIGGSPHVDPALLDRPGVASALRRLSARGSVRRIVDDAYPERVDGSSLIEVRRGHVRPYRGDGRQAAFADALRDLPPLDAGATQVSCVVLVGRSPWVIGRSPALDGDPLLFAALAGGRPRSTRREAVEAAVADVMALTRALPLRLGGAARRNPPVGEETA